MDVITTLSVMASAYGYYKASIYVYDAVDRSVRFYSFCKNSVGYIRQPIRYYQDNYQDKYNVIMDEPVKKVKVDSNIIVRSASCNDVKRAIIQNEIENMSKSLINFPSVLSCQNLAIEKEMELGRKNGNGNRNRNGDRNVDDEIPLEVGPKVVKRAKSISMCSNNSRNKNNSNSRNRSVTEVFEDDSGIQWVLVRNPDY